MGRHIELSTVSLGIVEVMKKGEVMRRQDSEKEAERPHAYSQFWLDIAAGRRVIGESQPEEAETTEPAPPQRSGRRSIADSSPGMRATAVVASVVEEQEHDEVREPEEAFTQEDRVDEAELPTLALDEPFAEAEELVEDEDYDDEEDEEEWGTRSGRKQAKPTWPTKPVKKPKPRRSF